METPVHIVWARVSAAAAEVPALDWLSDTERARHAAIRSPKRSQQFVAGRWLARRLLAQVHGGRPQDWQLSAPDRGPPLVLDRCPAPCVAISHSGPMAACAVCALAVGIDIEAPLRVRDVLGLAQVACHQQELAQLQALPVAAREARFYAFWTAKEAWLKRLGQDMAPRRMARIQLSTKAEARADVRAWTRDGWTLALACHPGAPLHWPAEPPRPAGAWRVNEAA